MGREDIFDLVSEYTPKGDQIAAIDVLINNIDSGTKEQVLLGATGTGKTFTIANIIKKLGKKTLVLAPNKTLAGQLYSELLSFFPNNHVEYFISYYDYYQPEAYIVQSDTHIDKDASINDEIDQLRNKVTSSLLSFDDTIVVASVSCIYGIGSKDAYKKQTINLRLNEKYGFKNLINNLIDLLYIRNDIEFKRGSFRVRGDSIDIILSIEREIGYKITFNQDLIESIKKIDALTGNSLESLGFISIYPATLFNTDKLIMKEAIRRIEEELKERLEYFKSRGLFLEEERLRNRTLFDLELMREVGTCSGIENYSRHLSLRNKGETPDTLITYFEKDFLLIVDESHVTIPQVRGMYFGDRSRKETLVNYGFRLESALDNRPLNFKEFEDSVDKVIYLSATPGEYELNKGLPVIEQIIRPTYLIDPLITIKPTTNQVDDLLFEIKKTIQNNERVLITCLTIKMSEDLTTYYKKLGIKVMYLHSEIKSFARLEIIRDLRLGKFDCLIGINLLREGLDLPEVSLVAILDADKEGFLRSPRSLIQTIGRAARNSKGRVIMYANNISKGMEIAINETERRRSIQEEFNLKYGLTPVTIKKDIRDKIGIVIEEDKKITQKEKLSKKEMNNLILSLEKSMMLAAKALDFEKAMELRDALFELKCERDK
jgi:excinuclease ABC subunit B